MPEDDPFSLWSRDENAPREDEQHKNQHILYHQTEGENGEVEISIFPSPIARQSAAIIAGQFQALLDTNVFTRDEAFKIVIESMSAVVVHHDHGDEDEDD